MPADCGTADSFNTSVTEGLGLAAKHSALWAQDSERPWPHLPCSMASHLVFQESRFERPGFVPEQISGSIEARVRSTCGDYLGKGGVGLACLRVSRTRTGTFEKRRFGPPI
jgi:hypothetical protein